MITRPDFENKQIVFVFPLKGDKISFRNDNLVIRDKEGAIKHQSTCYRLFLLCIVGDVTITSGLIRRAGKFGFTICLMTTSMKLYQILGHTMEGNTLLHKKQYQYEGLDLAKYIVENKVVNQIEAVKKLRIKSDNAAEILSRLCMYQEQICDTCDLQELLGIEGNAARAYFKEVYSTANWIGRKPRIKRDYINCTLDIGYTILFNFIDALLGIYDFDKYYGVLHKCYYMRKSLVCDLMEPLRPIIDLKVRKCINYGQFKESDFCVFGNRYSLKWERNSFYVQMFLETIMERKTDIFLYIQSYYRCFMKGKKACEFPVFNI